VPRVTVFYGIVIRMYFKEDNHPGRPLFHARHAGLQATYDIRTQLGPWCAPRRRRPRLIPCNELSTLMLMATMEIAPDLLQAKPTEGWNVWLRWADGLEPRSISPISSLSTACSSRCAIRTSFAG
jgi:hypothetical protein